MKFSLKIKVTFFRINIISEFSLDKLTMNSSQKFLICQIVQIIFGICFANKAGVLNEINTIEENFNEHSAAEKLPWFLDEKLQLFRSHENLVRG
jgi:hypothetical protein